MTCTTCIHRHDCVDFDHDKGRCADYAEMPLQSQPTHMPTPKQIAERGREIREVGFVATNNGKPIYRAPWGPIPKESHE